MAEERRADAHDVLTERAISCRLLTKDVYNCGDTRSGGLARNVRAKPLALKRILGLNPMGNRSKSQILTRVQVAHRRAFTISNTVIGTHGIRTLKL